MVICHFLLSGRVQGVGFRKFAYESAHDLELVGWVRNLKDGRVEILAQGASEHIEAFAEIIKKGPSGAQVTGVEKNMIEEAIRGVTFELSPDGATPWQKTLH